MANLSMKTPKLFMKPNGVQTSRFGGTNPYNAESPRVQALPALPGVSQALSDYGMRDVEMPQQYPPPHSTPEHYPGHYGQYAHAPLPPGPMTKEEIEEYLRKPKRNVAHAFLTKAKACINCTHFLAYIRGSDREYLNLCTYRGISPWNGNFTCAGSYCSLYCEKGKEASNLRAKSEPPKKRTRRTRAEIEAANKSQEQPKSKYSYEEGMHMAMPSPDHISKDIVMTEEEISVINPGHVTLNKQFLEQVNANNIDSRITFGGNKE